MVNERNTALKLEESDELAENEPRFFIDASKLPIQITISQQGEAQTGPDESPTQFWMRVSLPVSAPPSDNRPDHEKLSDLSSLIDTLSDEVLEAVEAHKRKQSGWVEDYYKDAKHVQDTEFEPHPDLAEPEF